MSSLLRDGLLEKNAPNLVALNKIATQVLGDPVLGRLIVLDSTREWGGHPSRVETLAQAEAKATADRGDVILAMPWHTETIASAVTLAKAGVSLVGLRSGGLRPAFTLTGDAAAKISQTGARRRIRGIDVLFGDDGAAGPIDAGIAIGAAAHDALIDDVEFYLASGGQRPTDYTTQHASALRTRWENNRFYRVESAAKPFPYYPTVKGWNHFHLRLDHSTAGGEADAVAAYQLLNIVGRNHLIVRAPHCEVSLTSDGAALLSLGFTGALEAIIAQTVFSVIDAGEFWVSDTDGEITARAGSTLFDGEVDGVAGLELLLDISGAALTAGTTVYEIFTRPAESGAYCTLGDLS